MSTEFSVRERQAGSKAASSLRVTFRIFIKSRFDRRSGLMEKSTVTAKYRDQRLDRLILKAPHYSFKQNFGSTLRGTTEETHRRETNVKSFTRHVAGRSVEVSPHTRGAATISAHIKGINYKVHNHISAALKSTKALETLANDLGVNRIVDITSQIDFK